MVEKKHFPQVAKTSYPKSRFVVNLKSFFFSTYQFFPGRGGFFPVTTFKEEYFNEKVAFYLVCTKIKSSSGKSTVF